MAASCLLDTNIATAILRQEAVALERYSTARVPAISIVILGELLFGAENSGKPQENRAQVFRFASTCKVYLCDEHTAWLFGAVEAGQRRLGKPIPENDLWIAASALQHDLMLVTRDTHFASVPGLKVEAW